MLAQYLYKLYLHTLSFPLIGALIIIGWKKDTLSANARVCGVPHGLGFRIRFYQAAALDLLRFLHGRYESPIFFRPQDVGKIDRLKSGPSLFLTAHFHNWELMGAWMTRQGIPLMSAARPMAQGISQSLLVRLRDRLGMKVLFGEIPRRALRHVRGGGCFGLLWDQRVPASVSESGVASVPASGSRAPLFGRTLSLDPLPRFLTRHAALPVYFGVLLPGGRFRVIQIAAPGIHTLVPRQPKPSKPQEFPVPASALPATAVAFPKGPSIPGRAAAYESPAPGFAISPPRLAPASAPPLNALHSSAKGPLPQASLTGPSVQGPTDPGMPLPGPTDSITSDFNSAISGLDLQSPASPPLLDSGPESNSGSNRSRSTLGGTTPGSDPVLYPKDPGSNMTFRRGAPPSTSLLDPLSPDPLLLIPCRDLEASHSLGHGSDRKLDPGAGSDEIYRLARRYHRVLECLVRAYPTYWYGLAHRRFLG